MKRTVAVFGGGVSGQGAVGLLGALGAETRIYDDAQGGGFTAAAARRHDLVIFSPGFAPDHPWLARARAAGALVLGELDLAALCWRGGIVAVTGTNGKTTLAEFLAHALRAAGRDATAAGNVGRAFSHLVAAAGGGTTNALAVCEVSSFQAEVLEHFRADATLWTNFAEDHLDRHTDLEGYFAAKWNLVTRTLPPGEGCFNRSGGDESAAPPATVFLGDTVRMFARRFDRPVGAAMAVETGAPSAETGLAGTVFADPPQRENFLLAQAWWRANHGKEVALHRAARTFPPGRHRLARIAEHDGVAYWNDSKATNFHATEAALARFAEPVVWIGGGRSKGGDIAGFVHRIAPRVRHAVLIGETAAELAFHCAASRVAHSVCSTLADAVWRAAEQAPPDGHVVLSPGFSSFDLFCGYEDRGLQFENLARQLGAVTPSLG